MRLNLQRQQIDVTQVEHDARQLYAEYQRTVFAMEAQLDLNATHELVEVEAQARSYYASRWNHLEQQAQIEFD
eukprot:2437700-Amphidinium_carterae.1